jgi:hypothetical protein
LVTGWSRTSELTFVPRQYIAVLPIMADPAARRNGWWYIGYGWTGI